MNREHGICCRLEAQDLRVSYDSTLALNLADLKVSGNVIAVVGHNGAGKSTLIKTLLGLLPPQSGGIKAYWHGPEGSIPLVPEHHMAFCPENGAVFADIPVESYIRLWCRIKRRNANYYRQAGAKYLEMLDIVPLLPKLGRELSKGQRRRVQTVIGLLLAPRLFLVDEPFCGLDVQKTSELGNVIYEAARETCFILASHRMDVVERLVDCVVVLKNGQVAASGSVTDVALQLCSLTAQIEKVSDRERVVSALKRSFPGALINHFGEHISVAGHQLTLAELYACVKANDDNGAVVRRVPPCLADALTFHLHTLAAKGQE